MAEATESMRREVVEGAPRIVIGARTLPVTRAWLMDVALPFAVTRLLIMVVGYFAMGVIPQALLDISYHVSENPFIDMWSRWDAMWYVRVAKYGYSWVPGEQSTIAFYPLYPALLKGLATLLSLGRESLLSDFDPLYTVAGVIISNSAFLVALTALNRLTALEFDEATARRATWYLAIYPGSLFLSAPYAEPLFLALIVSSFYLARQHEWGIGGYVAFLASMSRLVGAFAFLPFALEVMALWRRTRRVGAAWVAVVLPLLGALLFPAYLYLRFGDPLAFVTVQRAWQRQPGQPWDAFLRYLSEPSFAHAYSMSHLDLGVAIFALVVLAAGVKKLPLRYSLFAALVLFSSISTGTLTSLVRHSMGAFPLFMTLGWYGRYRGVDQAITVAGLMLLSLITVFFALWFWTA